MCCNTNYYGDKHYLELVAWHCPRKHIIIYMPFRNILFMFSFAQPYYDYYTINWPYKELSYDHRNPYGFLCPFDLADVSHKVTII